MLKKGMGVLLAAVFLMTMITACSNGTSSGTAPANPTDGSQAADGTGSGNLGYLNDEGVLPLVTEEITLTVFAQANNVGSDWSYGVNEFTTWLMDETGINLEITVVPKADAKEKLSLLLTSGDYPDIILRSELTMSEQLIYGTQGLLIPLEDLIEEYAPNARAMFERYPLAKTAFTLDDGHIYDLPSVNECYHCSKTQKMWVYSPWLDALGGVAPTTTDEFYEMLKIISETDLNGNGKNDEIPLAGSPKGWDTNMQGFLMQPFSYTETYVDNGTVKMPYAEEGWREGLRFLNKLYSEGLMAPESLIQDDAQLLQMGSMPEHVLAFVPGGYHGSFAPAEDWADWQTIAPLVGPDGRQQARYSPYSDYYASFAITDKCEYPEVAIRLADFMLSEEATLRNCHGVMGREWEYLTEDLPSIDGGTAIWQSLVIDGDRPPDSRWNQIGPTLRTSELRLGIPVDDEAYLEVSLYEESYKNYAPYLQPTDTVFPDSVLAFGEAAAAEVATTKTPFEEYVKEATAKFISGELSIDNDWDSYVSELERAGMSTLLTLYQEAYDAKFK